MLYPIELWGRDRRLLNAAETGIYYRLALILQQRKRIVTAEFFAPFEEFKFNHEREQRDLPPSFSTSFAAACAVPPVARRSSITTTF